MIETIQDYKNQYNSLTPPASSWQCHYLLASTMKPPLWPFAHPKTVTVTNRRISTAAAPIACKGTCSSLPASCIWSLLSSSPWRPYSTFLSRSSFFSALLLPCTVSILFPALETSVLLSKTLCLTDLFLITQDYAATRCCEIILSPIFFSPLAKERLAYWSMILWATFLPNQHISFFFGSACSAAWVLPQLQSSPVTDTQLLQTLVKVTFMSGNNTRFVISSWWITKRK